MRFCLFILCIGLNWIWSKSAIDTFLNREIPLKLDQTNWVQIQKQDDVSGDTLKDTLHVAKRLHPAKLMLMETMKDLGVQESGFIMKEMMIFVSREDKNKTRTLRLIAPLQKMEIELSHMRGYDVENVWMNTDFLLLSIDKTSGDKDEFKGYAILDFQSGNFSVMGIPSKVGFDSNGQKTFVELVGPLNQFILHQKKLHFLSTQNFIQIEAYKQVLTLDMKNRTWNVGNKK